MAINSIGQNTPIDKLLKKGGVGANGNNQGEKVNGNGFSETQTYSFVGSGGGKKLSAGGTYSRNSAENGGSPQVSSGGGGGNIFSIAKMIPKGKQVIKDGKQAINNSNSQNSKSQQTGQNQDSQISDFLSGMDGDISKITKNTDSTLKENKNVGKIENNFDNNKKLVEASAARSDAAGTTIAGLQERQAEIIEGVGAELQKLGIDGNFETIDEALKLKADHDEGLQDELNAILKKNGVKPEEKPDSQKPAGGKGAEQSGQDGGAISSASANVSAVSKAPSKIGAASSAGNSVLGGAGIHAAGQKGSGMIGAKVASDGVGSSSNVNGKAGAIKSGAQGETSKLQSAGAAGSGSLLSASGESAISAGGKAGEGAPVNETGNNDEVAKTEEKNEEKAGKSDDGCKTEDPKEKEIREKIAKSGEAGAVLGALGDEYGANKEAIGEEVTVQEGAEEQIEDGMKQNEADEKAASASEDNYEDIMGDADSVSADYEDKRRGTDDEVKNMVIIGSTCVAEGAAAGVVADGILATSMVFDINSEKSLVEAAKFAASGNDPMVTYSKGVYTVSRTLSTGQKVAGTALNVAALGLTATGGKLIIDANDRRDEMIKSGETEKAAYKKLEKENNSAISNVDTVAEKMEDFEKKYSNRKTTLESTKVQGTSGSQST